MGRKIIAFHAEWCIPCRGVAVHLEKAVALSTNGLQVERVDVEKQREIADEYHVSNLPTVVFIEEDGSQFRMTGLSDKTVKAIYNLRDRMSRKPNMARVSLAHLLLDIERLDASKDYQKRNTAIYAALALATADGLEGGIYIDKSLHDAERWPIVQINLPQGQVSWHVPASEVAWGGHSTPEKYERIHRFAKLLGFKVD